MMLALYKGPPVNDWMHSFAHWAVCAFTGSRYSHCELVIDGRSYSASARDGGVRTKVIDFTSGRWDLLPIQGDEAAAVAWFMEHDGAPYDWAGVLRFALPFLPQRRGQWFCSEACGAALGIAQPHKLTPWALAEMFAPE